MPLTSSQARPTTARISPAAPQERSHAPETPVLALQPLHPALPPSARALGRPARLVHRFGFHPHPHRCPDGPVGLAGPSPLLSLRPAGTIGILARRPRSLLPGPRRRRTLPAQAHQSSALRIASQSV